MFHQGEGQSEDVNSEAVRCQFFKIYDDDEVNEIDDHDSNLVVTEPKNVKTMDLRSWHGGFSGCLRRVRARDRSRHKHQMFTALSRAASSFLTRWKSNRKKTHFHPGRWGQPRR